MFCVECGKDGPIFRDGVCLECYLKTHSFTKGPEVIDLPVCSHCNSYKYKNTWTSDLFGDVIRRIIKNTFQISNELKKIDINTECKEEKERMVCKVFISGFVDDAEISEEHEIIIRLKKTACDVCSKKFGGYHEAIVQIRTDDRKLSKQELNNLGLTVENLVETLRAKGNRSLFITDIGEEHGGLDFYLSNRAVGLIIAKKIQEQYGGIIKQSSKNMGMKDSRQIYRMTYLIRLPSFTKGDFLKYNKSTYYILSIHRNKIKMMKLSNWEETITDIKTIQKSSILGGKELIKEMILVSQTKNELQLMDPKTYEIKIVRKPKPITLNSEKINVLKLDEQIFLLPK